MSDEFDLEDIESMLYSQVYHVSSENQDDTGVINSNNNANNDVTAQDNLSTNHITSKSKRQNNRYFHSEKDNFRNPSIYISFEQNAKTTPYDTPPHTVENIVPVEINGVPTATDNFVDQFRNNITINQYNIPVIINPEVEGTEKTPNRYKKFSEKKKKKHERQRAKNKANRKKRKRIEVENMSCLIVEMNENAEEQINSVICLSDDSNSECVIVQDAELLGDVLTKEVSTGFPKKYSEDDKNCKKPESDDDIIYIPPPPVEVINIDVEEPREEESKGTLTVENHNDNKSTECRIQTECKDTMANKAAESHSTLDSSSKFSKPANEKYNPKERKELLCTPDSSASNDFLENATIENSTHKFNFSLHGSDFNSASVDFVVPAKPVETCETESSCSTNDLNRDFNNSVKSLVFNEVEFPKTDIFSEKNLESFGNYITPKRGAVGHSKTPKKSTGKAKLKKIDIVTSSDSSSSESDYEHTDNLKTLKDSQKLPHLSPMQFSETVTHKKKSKRTSSQFFKKQENVSVERKKHLYKSKADADDASETETCSDDGIKLVIDLKNKQTRRKLKSVKEQSTPLISKKKKTLQENTYMKCDKKKKIKTSDCESKKSRTKKKKILSDAFNSSEESEEQTKHVESSRKKKPKILDCTLNVHPIKKKIYSDISDASEECNHPISLDTSQKKPKKLHTIESEKRKKRHSSDSKSIEHSDDANVETLKKKKKKKSVSLESKCTSDYEENLQISITENDKKKIATLPTDSENGDVAVEKKSKKRKKHCSTSSSKSLEEVVDVSDVDEYIEIEILDPDHSQLTSTSRSNPIDLDVGSNKVLPLSGDKGSSLSQGNTTLEENRIEIVESTEHNIYSHTHTTETLCHFATITQTPTDPKEEDSDEEIVVDDTDFSLSNLVVVDEMNSTALEEEEIKVVSSDSDLDFSDLTEVGNNIQLANCSHNIDITNRSEEIVVDDGFQSKFSRGRRFWASCSDFDLVAIHNSQTDDPQSWRISHKDRCLPFNSERTRGPRCNRCRQFGHIAARCIEKWGPPKCSLCGNPGHQEPRCTKKMCTQCGNEGDYSTTYCWKCFKFRNSICRICNMRGHIAKMCPDLWRRYHLTTKEGPIVVPQRAQSEPVLQWCSGCAQQGHLEYECDYIERQYPPMTPHIVSYKDILSQGGSSDLQADDAPAPRIFGPQVVTDVQPSTKESDVQNRTCRAVKDFSFNELAAATENNATSNIISQDAHIASVLSTKTSQDISIYSNVTSQDIYEDRFTSNLTTQDAIVAITSNSSCDETYIANVPFALSSQDTCVGSVSKLTSRHTNIASVSSNSISQDMNLANVPIDLSFQDRCVDSISPNLNYQDTNVTTVSSNLTCALTNVASISPDVIFHQDPNIASTSSNLVPQDLSLLNISVDLTAEDSNIGNISSMVTYQNTTIASASSSLTSQKTNLAYVSSNSTSLRMNIESVSSNITRRDINVTSPSSNLPPQDTNFAPPSNLSRVPPLQIFSPVVISLVSSDSSAESSDEDCTVTTPNENDQSKNKKSVIQGGESSETENVPSANTRDSVNQSNVTEEQESFPINLSTFRRRDYKINVTIMIRCMARESQYRIKRMLLRYPAKFREYLEQELNELELLRHVTNVGYFRKLLSKYDRLKKGIEPLTIEGLAEQCFWLRLLNMFVFGLHRYGQGTYHMGVLRNYLENPVDNASSRKNVMMSHTYIFGIKKHNGTNYKNIISKILCKTM